MSNAETPTESDSISTDHDRPWNDPQILQYLYREQGYTQQEIADQMGCSQSTIHRALHRHDINTRAPHEEKVHPCCWLNEEGYAYADSTIDGDQHRVGIHELVAIADGSDPETVFDDRTEVHHRTTHKVDFGKNIEFLSIVEHRERHVSSGYNGPEAEEILDQ